MAVGDAPLFLVGRDHERARLDGARRGQGGALRIDGPPGVGKSALLATAVPADVPYLVTTGTETETSLPLAGLEHLLAPLPEVASALRENADPAALLRAVSERLAAAAPLVVLVDDVQWLDPTSRDAVVFLARRAHRLGIALVAVWSVRGPAPAPWPDIPTLPLDDLAPQDAVALACTHGLAPAVATAVAATIGGNPLALTEARSSARRSTTEQRRRTAVPPTAGSPNGPTIPSARGSWRSRRPRPTNRSPRDSKRSGTPPDSAALPVRRRRSWPARPP